MMKKKGMRVQGWFASLEVRKSEEMFTIGFTKETYSKPKKTVVIKPLELVQGFLKAAKSVETMELWKYEYGLPNYNANDLTTEFHPQRLIEEAEKIELLLKAFSLSNRLWKKLYSKPKNEFPWQKKYACDKTKNVFQYVEQHHINDLRFMNDLRIWDFNQNYVLTAENIVPLLWYETIENIRQEKYFDQCPCGKWYIRLSRQHKNHCTECPPPSHRYSAKRKEYMRDYRKKNKVKPVKREKVKKGITPERKGIIRAYKNFYGK